MPERLKKISEFIKSNLDLVGVLDGKEAFKGPEMLHIDLTNRCNNQCLACWCRSPLLKDKCMPPEEQVKTLPYEIIKGILDDAYSMGTRQVKFVGGGEPFMHPEVMKLVEYAVKKGYSIDINTNFTLVNEEAAKKFVDLGVDLMTVSLWAATPKTYVATHANQTGKTFQNIEKVLNFITRYKKETGKTKPAIKLYNVIFNKNYKEINRMIDFAFSTGSEAVQFTVMDPKEGSTDSLLLNNKEQDFLIKEIEKAKKRINFLSQTISKKGYENQVFVSSFQEFERRVKSEKAGSGMYDEKVTCSIPCSAGWMFSRIMADGNVVPCLKGPLKPVGNVYKKRFRQIWEGKKQKEFRYNGTHLSRTNPYFAQLNCLKTCDNLWQNESIYIRLTSLSKSQRRILKGAGFMLKIKKAFKN